MEKLVRLSSQKSDRNQDALHQIIRDKLRARNFQSQDQEIGTYGD
jgi:hypothetical protein